LDERVLLLIITSTSNEENENRIITATNRFSSLQRHSICFVLSRKRRKTDRERETSLLRANISAFVHCMNTFFSSDLMRNAVLKIDLLSLNLERVMLRLPGGQRRQMR
jgi:hypothetical protein